VRFQIFAGINIGITNLTKFIYKFNKDGYFIKLIRLYPCDCKIPQVNSTMSKVPIKIKYVKK
jgi:hypothetical protein